MRIALDATGLIAKNRMRPHLAAIDRVQHLAAEDEPHESGIEHGERERRRPRRRRRSARRLRCRARSRERPGETSGCRNAAIVRERARAAGCKPGCARGQAADSGTRRARRRPDARGPRTGRPRSDGTIGPTPAARHGSGRRRRDAHAPRAPPAASSDLSASQSSVRRAPVPAPEKLTIDTPEQIALEFPLASVGSRFLALALDTLVQAGTFLVFLIFVFAVAVVGVAAGRELRGLGRGPRDPRRLHPLLRLLRRVRDSVERPDAGQTMGGLACDKRKRAADWRVRGHSPQPAADRRSASWRSTRSARLRLPVATEPAARRSRRGQPWSCTIARPIVRCSAGRNGPRRLGTGRAD